MTLFRTLATLIVAPLLVTLTIATADAAKPDRAQRAHLQGPGFDQGTFLMADLAASDPVCQDEGSGSVTLSATLVTSGSVDSAEVFLQVDGGDAHRIGTIEPQDFVHDGRTKRAFFSTEASLPNGKYDVTLCFVQSGAKGRLPKQTCGDVSIDVDCTPSAQCLDDRVFFGNIVRNPALCNGQGTPHVPIHFRGAPYEGVEVRIEGPDGFALMLPMRRSGESCIHHALWDTRDGNHGGLGDYTFTVVGEDGALAVLDRELRCSRR